MLGQGSQPSVTRLSKVLSLLLVIGCLVSYFVPSSVGYLALVPGRTLPMIWNLITAGFLITNPIELLVEIGLLLVLARLVEPTYGSKEFLKLIFVVTLMTSVSVFAVVCITFATTQNGKLLYTEFCGFHGVLAGLLVGVKQIMPDHEIKLLGFLRISVKWQPEATHQWQSEATYQWQPQATGQGDPSDEFKFSSFFPPFMAPAIDPVASIVGVVFRMQHAPGASVKALNMSGTPSMLGSDATDANRRSTPAVPVSRHNMSGTPPMLGSDVTDARRRRERGAKALEERLGLKNQAPAESDVENATSTASPTTASS
eukprot:gene4187-14288_t